MKKELLMSMLARNAALIHYQHQDALFSKSCRDYFMVKHFKKQIAKLAEIQKAIKLELRGKPKSPRKHGKNHPHYHEYVERQRIIKLQQVYTTKG